MIKTSFSQDTTAKPDVTAPKKTPLETAPDSDWEPVIDPIHKSQNAPVPYPTMLHLEQKCTHFCSEWNIVGYGTSALCDLFNLSVVACLLGVYLIYRMPV